MNAADTRAFLLQLIQTKSAELDKNRQYLYASINNGALICVSVESIRFIGDDIIVFDGFDSKKRPCTVVQHITQLNMCLSTWELPEPKRVGKVVKFERRDRGDD